MANLFVDLPLPAQNGPGAAVDTSGMGVPKTIEVVGTFPGATITVEASVDGGVTFAPVVAFANSGAPRVIAVVADFMRVNVSGRKTSVPFSANCDVGAPAVAGAFAAIAIPAGNGPGAPTDISAFGEAVTIIVGGTFAGARVLIEISEDGLTYAPLCSFAGQGGSWSGVVTANFVRTDVSGRKSSVPFAATAAIGGVAVSGGGGGGGGAYSPPEKWAQGPVPEGQAAVALPALVSIGFDDIKAIVDGSIVGLSTRLSDAITDGTATIVVTINGVPGTLAIASDSGTLPTGGEITQADGIDTYVAGDLLGLQITTTGDFAPTDNLVEAWLQLKDA